MPQVFSSLLILFCCFALPLSARQRSKGHSETAASSPTTQQGASQQLLQPQAVQQRSDVSRRGKSKRSATQQGASQQLLQSQAVQQRSDVSRRGKSKRSATQQGASQQLLQPQAVQQRRQRVQKGKAQPADPVPTTAQIQQLKGQQTQLINQLAASNTALQTTRKHVQVQVAQLQTLNGQITDQEKIVATIRTEVDTLNGRVAQLSDELSVMEQELALLKRRYARGVRYMHRHRLLQNKLMFLFSAQNFSDMFRRLRYLESYVKYQRAEGKALMEKELHVRQQRGLVDRARNAKAVALQHGQAAQQKLEGQQKEQQNLVAQLSAKEKELQQSIAQQQRQINQLTARIDQLIQQEILAAERRRKAEEERRRKAAEEAQRRKAAEARARAEAAARARAEAAARLERQRKEAEAARQRAERAKQEAEAAQQRAEDARQRADQARREAARSQRAEQARQSAEQARVEALQKQQAAEAARREEQRQQREKQLAEQQQRREAEAQLRQERESQQAAREAEALPERSASDGRLSGSFSANKGRLPMPITGGYSISSRFGSYSVEGLRGVQLDNKGINLTGAAGAQARCVYDGEVSAVFHMGGMINVLVRHGAYISVYCNLSSASVRQGQRVSARQPLGSVARDAAGNYTLHFQLRHETTKLNPEHWLAR